MLLGAGCDPRDPPVVVPPSSTCNRGIGPQACVIVPPQRVGDRPARPPWTVDGVASTFEVATAVDYEEYFGAYELPYTSTALRSSADGRIRVALEDDGVPGGTATLHVFLESIPLATNERFVVVYLDLNRFAPSRATVGADDRAYAIDTRSGTVEFRRPRPAGPLNVEWGVASPPEPFDAVLGRCRSAGGPMPPRFCDAELAIQIPDSVVATTGPELAGIGFAVSTDRFTGAFPEQVVTDPGDREPGEDRTRYQTLLFGSPEGAPIDFMSFNVRRFEQSIQSLTGDPFDDVLLSDLARVVAPHDIVALQELWDRDEATKLVELVNIERASSGLAPMNIYGPVNFDAHFFIESVTGAPYTEGGLWILSHFPALDARYIVYEACRGEDCVKAKGVQWVRLGLNAPSDENTRPECLQGQPGADCPRLPTDEMFIDVFNTHTQAGSPELCKPGSQIAAGMLALFEAIAAPRLVRATISCSGTSDEAVRRAQIDQLARFVDDVAARDRPSIVAGDFNIDGRQLGRTSRQYGYLLHQVGLTPLDETGADEPTDALTPWPAAFDWDLDHGDLAREDPSFDWAGIGRTTTVGEQDGFMDPATCMGGNLVRNRLDYVFVRPGPVIAPTLGDPPPAPGPVLRRLRYALARSDGDTVGSVWSSPFPVVGDDPTTPEDERTTCPKPPVRISDHRPVIARFQFVPFREPARYHPDFPHTLQTSVTGFDGTGTSDCVLDSCAPIDPYARLRVHEVRVDGETSREQRSTTCNTWSVSQESDACMQDWRVGAFGTLRHNPGVTLQHSVWVRILDEDLSPDDAFDILPPDVVPPDICATLPCVCVAGICIALVQSPELTVNWETGEVRVRDPVHDVQPSTWRDRTLVNNDPIRWCTRPRSIRACLEARIDEISHAGSSGAGR